MQEEGASMSNKKLTGIIAACGVAIIVAILWAGTSPAETHMLTAYVSPLGTGFVSPSGGEYKSGAHVTLIASPASGYTFDHWSGDASGNSTSVTITMKHYSCSIIANFAPTVLDFLMLVSPASGAADVPIKNVGFSWTAVDGADEYYLVVSANPDLSIPIVKRALTPTAYMLAGTALEYDTVYYWQVKALSGGTVISESTIGVFLTYLGIAW
jgi:uncharacterized repeat protein (TIGR02543 family)